MIPDKRTITGKSCLKTRSAIDFNFLGHVAFEGGFTTDTENVNAVQNRRVPGRLGDMLVYLSAICVRC